MYRFVKTRVTSGARIPPCALSSTPGDAPLNIRVRVAVANLCAAVWIRLGTNLGARPRPRPRATLRRGLSHVRYNILTLTSAPCTYLVAEVSASPPRWRLQLPVSHRHPLHDPQSQYGTTL